MLNCRRVVRLGGEQLGSTRPCIFIVKMAACPAPLITNCDSRNYEIMKSLPLSMRRDLPRPKTVQAILGGYLFLAGLSAASGQTLEVVPARVLEDEPAVIRATGLAPNERISIQAELRDGGGQPWSAEVEFIADAQGVIDTSRQGPVNGSYNGESALGLVWSMRPAAKHIQSYVHPGDFGTQEIQFHLLRNAQQAASARLEQLGIGPGVRQIEVKGQILGQLFLPNTTEARPGVLVLGGSEGGLPLAKAAWLASRGYVALALAYFRYQDLPAKMEAIALEYFGTAIAWMMQRPEVRAGQIAVMGTSRGGELALQLGSMYPQIKAVVAYVPADVRVGSCCGATQFPYAWTWRGQPLAFARMHAVGGRPEGPTTAAIAVERTQGPILLISGESDGVWPSSAMADSVFDRLKRAKFAYAYQHLKYPHAGHRAGRPEIIPMWHGPLVNPTSGRDENIGGKPEGDAQSTLDAIPRVLQFLRESLPGSTSPN